MPRAIVFLLSLALSVTTGPRLALAEHPQVSKVEETDNRPNRLVLRVTIAQPLEAPDLHQIADDLRSRVRRTEVFNVHFVLPGWVDQGDMPYYASKLTRSGQEPVFSITLPPSEVRQQLQRLNLVAGEKIERVWVNHHFVAGGVALVSEQKQRWYVVLLADTTTRYLMRDVKTKRAGRGMSSVDSEGAVQNIGILHRPDDALEVYTPSRAGQLGDKPWYVARPWKDPVTPPTAANNRQ